ncbi:MULTISPECIES: TrbI/VirB10 family protein [unclassified Bradyrhizobium]|uniref:TrbI/VirB10 family protein n=1 Tax=unclassified Bradyrhizobium TaxID=2631580 RepID=UPI0028EC9D0A|nr:MULTISPECIES: TrbI/VirB10 family protein [unclassified Bradyrhizobium]
MSAEDKGTSARPNDPEPAADPAAPFRLGGEPPRITRLSRKILASGSAVALALIAGAVLWALQSPGARKPAAQPELASSGHREVADGVSSLPRDYTQVAKDVPVLGPPLPGDLGRPILASQGQTPGSSQDQDQQRREQEQEAARVSRLFATATTTATQPSPNVALGAGLGGMPPATDDAFAQNGRDRKLAFVNGPVDRRTTSPDRITRPASPYVVQAGTVIPGALITGIRSDLPGQVTAQVTENVFDTPTGRLLLIPQGARLIGAYDSQVAIGQSRVLLVWTRLILPNGRSIVLERQQGADSGGYSGLDDEVDNHWKQLIGSALLSTLLSVGSEVNAGGNGNANNAAIIQALRQGFGNATSQTGQQLVRQQMNIQPTLTIRPGFPVRVMVNHDLVLEPYRG